MVFYKGLIYINSIYSVISNYKYISSVVRYIYIYIGNMNSY